MILMTKKIQDSKPKVQKDKHRFTELERQFKEEHEAKLRLAAEFANYQKRAEQERETLTKHANRRLLEKLFPIFDNFYRASTHTPEVSLEDLPKLTEEDYKKIFNYFSGLRLIEKQLEQALAEAGLKRISTVGVPFDHNLHEAISHEPSAEVPAEYIITEVEAGWQIDNNVIKPAKVRVSKG